MNKDEFFKKYQEIILKTNGGNDDYVVALCQISNLINEFANEKDQQIADLQSQLAITEKALEIACEDCPLKCPNPPELYNLQDEYGSDEPYWVQEGGCEFDNPADCLECTINFYKQKATEILRKKLYDDEMKECYWREQTKKAIGKHDKRRKK